MTKTWVKRALALTVMAGLPALSFGLAAKGQQAAAPHPGQAVYQQYCAACHNGSNDRAPTLQSLQSMGEPVIRQALTEGAMKPMADPIPRPQLEQLIAWLAPQQAAGGGRGRGAGGPIDPSWINGNMCPTAKRVVDLKGKPSMTYAGVDKESTRHMPAAQAGLSGKQLANLEVAWTLAVPSTQAMGGAPVIIGSTLFYGAPTARTVFAVDTKTGCTKWSATVETGIRSSLSYGQLGAGGQPALALIDAQGFVVTLNPLDGKVIWRADGKRQAGSPVRASPILYKDWVIVPNSNGDVGAAGQANVECCKGHGSVVALSAKDGHRLWVWNTMEDAKPVPGRKNRIGVQVWGPSGAPIWANVSIDEKRNAVLAATGENNSPPATNSSDAMVSIDLATGKTNWMFQGVQNDIWSTACPSGARPNSVPGPNCLARPESVLGDFDFGGPPVLVKAKSGDVVLGGQKSGHTWAVDAATGKVLWGHQFGKGTTLGGVHWGVATDGVRLYAPIADPYPQDGPPEPGLNAVDIKSGKVLWRWSTKADCGNGRDKLTVYCETKHGLSAVPLVIDQTVLAGSLDGKLYVFDGPTGKVLATYDTARSFETLNKVPGAGGTIDSQAVAAGDGMVFVGSGYANFNQKGGNVLIAYRPKGKK